MTQFLMGHQDSILVHLQFFAAFDAGAHASLVETRDETLEILANFDFLNMLYGQPRADHLIDRRVLQPSIAWRPAETSDDITRLRRRSERLRRQTLAFIRSSENGWFNTQDETEASSASLIAEIRGFQVELTQFRSSATSLLSPATFSLADLFHAHVTTADVSASSWLSGRVGG